MAKGFVYILISSNCDFIKIGGTQNPISERVRAINLSTSYRKQGPWEISDFLHVKNWRHVERSLHEHFRKERKRGSAGPSELFALPAHRARMRLRSVPIVDRVDGEIIRSIFKDSDLQLYLYRIFQMSGLFGALDLQGAWTLSVDTKTVGGRWFTLNIGPHEVAYCNKSKSHGIVLDKLIQDYPQVLIWLKRRKGKIGPSPYRSGRDRSVSVSFESDFAEAEKFFALPGVRRAMAAYWSEGLADLRQRGAKSSYARFHNHSAVSELIEYNYARSADQWRAKAVH